MGDDPHSRLKHHRLDRSRTQHTGMWRATNIVQTTSDTKIYRSDTMMDPGASHRPAGVTARVKPTRFFVSDPHESRRPSYASSMSKYSQATPKPIDCAAFQAMSLEDARSLVPQPLCIAVRPGANRTPALQSVPVAKRSDHGDISHVSEQHRSIFESPRPAPPPPRQSRGRGPPLAYENHAPRQSRARSLSNSFKEGMQRIGSFARRRSSVAKEDIRLVMNSMRGDECGLGERMSADEKAAFAEEVRAREKRQQEAHQRAEVKRRVRDDFDRYPRALPPRRGLRRVQGSVGISAGGPQEPALPRKMRTLSGTTDRLSRLGPLIDAGPQNIKIHRLRPSGLQAPALPRKMRTPNDTTDRKSRPGPSIDAGPQTARGSGRQPASNRMKVSQPNTIRHDSILADQQQFDRASANDDRGRWQIVARRSSIKYANTGADKNKKDAIVHGTAALFTITPEVRHFAIKRKPVPQQHYESRQPAISTLAATKRVCSLSE
ncbi:hypothetical protein LTR91_023898 [Friedmanniomyces endolithicus]|uniref:Uncharacterized protein n=1 Tax=Friedmanniomyces endolithicus TaxID=329885 RepID=A0AAN6H3J7_9PEZI|nr:hypothetical protein LTS02_015233 [Friedmanniomyces endolithicus]KAK0857318.1 hypothetical protein LTR03_000808 [Friedmanniomyces endolithicus]KAK0892920.1 hypothetical protein LTR57_024187 [Friedmanniomyces endolithicus]KAK0953339.1 hypothetical protein LTR91_023898 [Friedmanniomyces endolithicus]